MNSFKRLHLTRLPVIVLIGDQLNVLADEPKRGSPVSETLFQRAHMGALSHRCRPQGLGSGERKLVVLNIGPHIRSRPEVVFPHAHTTGADLDDAHEDGSPGRRVEQPPLSKEGESAFIESLLGLKPVDPSGDLAAEHIDGDELLPHHAYPTEAFPVLAPVLNPVCVHGAKLSAQASRRKARTVLLRLASCWAASKSGAKAVCR